MPPCRWPESASADSARNHDELVRLFAARGVSVLAHAPAQDQNGFAVTRAAAAAGNLTRLSDLRPIAGQLVLGGPPECAERLLCRRGLERVYGLEFKRFIPIASRAVTADALVDGEIDVGLMDTTDAYLAAKGLVLLADDRKLQPADNIAPVVRTEIVRRLPPPAPASGSQATTSWPDPARPQVPAGSTGPSQKGLA